MSLLKNIKIMDKIRNSLLTSSHSQNGRKHNFNIQLNIPFLNTYFNRFTIDSTKFLKNVLFFNAHYTPAMFS